MLILMLPLLLKILSVPLIIIVGESNIDEKSKTIALLVLSFLYNNFMGMVTWAFVILTFSSLSILTIIIIGAWIIAINLYIKEKIDINNTLYIVIIVIAFLLGVIFK